MSRFGCLMMVVILTAASYARPADEPFPESMVVLRGQPSVFVVAVNSDVILDTPLSVTLNRPALNADLRSVQFTGTGPVTDADRYWTLIGQNPGKYLVASKELQRLPLENVRNTAGSAFAVSREGIFLTNAHVVANKSETELGDVSLDLVEDRVANDVKAFAEILGTTKRPVEEINQIADAIIQWYALRSRLAGSKFRSARIILDYKVNSQKRHEAMRKDGLTAAFKLEREEISVPTTVLAMGESMPGLDVAVLKATFDPAEQAKLLQRDKQRKLPGLDAMLADIQNDRIVCLTLGNSDDVLPQARVQALGMPGDAFNHMLMDIEARFKVSARNGQIGQTKRMKGGWDAFEMNAAIDHGDSGGPVLDVQGRVIAINMGVAKDRTNPLRLAVPINLAREMLAKAGIKPDPGKLSAHWEQALRYYADGKYEECFQQCQAVIRIQEGQTSFLSGRQGNWYIKDMAGRCLQKLGKIPGGK